MKFYKIGVLALAIVSVSLSCWLASRDGGPEPPKPTPTAGPTPPPKPTDWTQINSVREQARRLQEDQKWCDGRDRWQEVLTLLPAPSDNESGEVRTAREEATRSLKTLEDQCLQAKSDKRVMKTSVTPSPESKPAEIPPKELLDYYPAGRRVRSRADLNISGQGSNEQWFLQTDAHFAYRYRVIGETLVKEHRERPLGGAVVVFEQRFVEVVQLRAVSHVELRLKAPQSPLLTMLWPKVDMPLRQIPIYEAVRKAAGIIQMVDPGLKRTLTYFADDLGLAESEDVQLAAQVDKLQGMRFEMEYDNGRGVTYIRILDGPALDNELLEQIAAGSSLMLDYFVFPAMNEKQEGDEWTVSPEEVAGMFPMAYDARAKGELTLRRGLNQCSPTGHDLAVLEVVGGDLQVEQLDGGSTGEASARPTRGRIWYDRQSLMVREAEAAWTGTTSWQSRDHLLFGTRNARNLRVETYYEAERVDESAMP